MALVRETYYDILGIKPGATMGEIHDAYRTLARAFHPDVNSNPDANQRMARINLAYETLSDPKRRARYDLELALARWETDAAPTAGRTRPAPSDERTRGGGLLPLTRLRWLLLALLAASVFVFAGSGSLNELRDNAVSIGETLVEVVTYRSRIRSRIRDRNPTTQERIEDCFIRHWRASQGDVEEQKQLTVCLEEARASPTAAP